MKFFSAKKLDAAPKDFILVPDAEFIQEAKIAKNTGNSCGFVAASLLADYWHYRAKKSPYPGKKLSQEAIQKLLLSQASTGTSWAYNVAKHWKKNHFLKKVKWQIFWLKLYKELRAGRPVILFGGLPDPNSPKERTKYMNHAVLAYGYKKEKGKKIILTHFGWQGHSAVLMRTPFHGSAMYFKPDWQENY